MARIVPIIVAALLALAGETAVAATPPLSQHGRWVTDADGRVVILHGVNMVYKRPPYHAAAAGFDAADARFLRQAGLNTVRLGIIYAGVEPSPGSYNDAYLARIAESVRVLSRERIFAMLDFHQDLYNERFQGEGWPDWAVQDDGLPAEPKVGFPGNYIVMPALNRAFDNWWNNSPGPGGIGLQDRYAAAWRHVAQRFRNEPYNMGYDLLNEPWPGTGWQLCANTEGCPAFDRNKLTPFSQRVYDRIREVDGRNIVWYEPNVIYNNGPKTHHGDIGPRSGMSFHVYCLSEGSTEPPDSEPLDESQAAQCEPFEQLPFENSLLQSGKTGDTTLLTEFGATNDLGEIERIEEFADRFLTGWQYWHYCECDDPTTAGSGVQGIVIDAKEAPTGSNLKSAKLDRIVRAYPRAVAGTPRSFDFDRAERRFDLEYSTARAGGGSFPVGVDTDVFVPRRHFPTGYDVTVRGAEAISKPGSQRLILRNCTGRDRVTLVVKAGRGRENGDCKAPRLKFRVKVRPRRVSPGVRTRFRVKVKLNGKRVRRARVRIAGRVRRTNRRGIARLRVTLRKPGKRYRVRVKKNGVRGRAYVRVRRR